MLYISQTEEGWVDSFQQKLLMPFCVLTAFTDSRIFITAFTHLSYFLSLKA